jgi:signal peptidase I
MQIATKLIRRVLLGLAVAIGVLWMATFVLRESGQLFLFVVPTASMGPTLTCGEHVAATRYWFGSPARNDVVIFHASFDPHALNPHAVFVKRVVAVAGDRVEGRDGHLFVNGRMADADPLTGSFGPHTVAADSYFVLGDQREVSDDSRFFGDVPRSAIMGHVVAVYWPPGHLGGLAAHPPTHPGPTSC